MNNHTHLLMSERVEEGIKQFQKKLTGYARYFNERHKRRGRLFDTTKKVLITSEPHFLYILHYIHLNGLDNLLSARGWREREFGTVRDVRAALEHLKKDRWSSFHDYCGIHNFPSILTKTLFQEKDGDYEAELRAHLLDRNEDLFKLGTLE